MTKKKTLAEQALFDFKKNLKVISKQVDNLQRQLEECTRQKNDLEKELIALREAKDLEIKNIKTYLAGDNYDNYKIGYDFERHVAWWMNKKRSKYELKIWQGDKMCHPYENKEPIYPSWNRYPDLVYADDKKKKVLALECKFRCDGIYELSKSKYLDYKHFEQLMRNLKNVDVQICIMIGSISEYRKHDRYCSPNRPEYTYCIPISYFDESLKNTDTCSIDLREFPQFLVMKRLLDGTIDYIDQNIPF